LNRAVKEKKNKSPRSIMRSSLGTRKTGNGGGGGDIGRYGASMTDIMVIGAD